MSQPDERPDMFGSSPSKSPITISTDKEEPIESSLLNPHYNDRRFENGSLHTIFLAPHLAWSQEDLDELRAGVDYTYSDRCIGWYTSVAIESAWDGAKKEGHLDNSPAMLEAYLKLLHQDPALELVHILAGVNRANGFPYRVYGTISK